MKHLDKVDSKRRLELVDQLANADNVLVTALDTYNTAVAAAWTPVQEAIDAYNALAEEANGFRNDVVAQIEEFIEGKSEAWKDGERGQAYCEWRDAWEGSYFDTVDLRQPEPLTVEDVNASDELRDLDEEVAV